jgi:hypothetical protein
LSESITARMLAGEPSTMASARVTNKSVESNAAVVVTVKATLRMTSSLETVHPSHSTIISAFLRSWRGNDPCSGPVAVVLDEPDRAQHGLAVHPARPRIQCRILSACPSLPVSQQSAGFVAQETGSPRRALLLQGLTVGQQVFRSLLRPVTIMFRRQRGLRIWRGSDPGSSRGMGRPLEQQLPWMRPHITRGCCSPVTDIEPRVLYMI